MGKLKAALCAATILGSAGHAAADDGDDSFWNDWSARAHSAMALQPHWTPTLMTASPRLTQVERYDQYWESTNTGVSQDVFGAGKGFEFIPADTTSVTIDLPPYDQRSRASNAAGWGDWPALLIKQRLAASPEDADNYVVTAYLNLQAPIGAQAFTNKTWVATPGLGFGKGWGDFDVQGSLTVALPTHFAGSIGTALASNLALQWHIQGFIWPEIEFNDTTWSAGAHKGLNQLFMTAGAVIGNFPLFDNYALGIGLGYQFALAPSPVMTAPLTPAYDHNWLLSLRVGY